MRRLSAEEVVKHHRWSSQNFWSVLQFNGELMAQSFTCCCDNGCHFVPRPWPHKSLRPPSLL